MNHIACLRRLVGLAALLLMSSSVLAERYTVPLWVPAASGAPQGMLRIVNAADESGTVTIHAIDDEGARSGPATFTLAASAAVEFTATDLASGHSAKGLSGGIGEALGDARLEIETELDIVPLAYGLSADGTLSPMHDTVRAASAHASGPYRYEVAVFNPASDVTQASRLRLINPGEAEAAVTILGRDDSGAVATGGEVTLTLAPGTAKTLTAQQLEAGDASIAGQLGAGTGRWRLTVSSGRPVQVVNVVSAAAGYWSNLSTTALRGFAPANRTAFAERFDGRSLTWESDRGRSTLSPMSGGRFTETVESDGVTTSVTGSFTYATAGPDAGRLTLDYDSGGACAVNLYFSAFTAGWLAAHCSGADHPADGSRVGGDWSADDGMPPGPGDGTQTSYGVDGVLPGIPTSGFFVPARLSGDVQLQSSGSGTTIVFGNGGLIETGDTRYTCVSASGCEVLNGRVTRGTLARTAAGTDATPDTSPGFAAGSGPGDPSYTVGTAIDALALPEASGGDGALTYSLTPGVPGLMFNTTTRRLTGTPTTAGTYAMTYTARDVDGDTATLNFTITVLEDTSTGGSLGVCQVGMLVRSGESCTYPGTTDEFSVDERGRGAFLAFRAGIRISIEDQTIDGRVYDFLASHQGEGVWRIERVAGNTEPPMDGGALAGPFDLHGDNASPYGIAHVNGRFHVVDSGGGKVYAYSSTGERDASADFDLHEDNASPRGIAHANGRFHVVDWWDERVYTYSGTGQLDAAASFDLHEDNASPYGIAHVNGRFHVVDSSELRVYAYSGTGEHITNPGEPYFPGGSGPGNRTYTVGAAIDALTLPQASGGDGELTYSLSPEVPGLTFNTTTRRLTGTPTTAGSYDMTYTATDEDGDTDALDFTIAVEAPDDHGDSRSAATRITLGGSTAGVLTAGDSDYFRVEMSGSGTLTAYSTGGTDTRGVLEDSAGQALDSDDDGGDGTNFRVSAQVGPGTYYIRVRGFSSSTTGPYTLWVTLGSGDSDFENYFSLSNDSCRGSPIVAGSNLYNITISGTLRALRQVPAFRVVGYVNTRRLGSDDLPSMSVGDTEDFSIQGTMSLTVVPPSSCDIDIEGIATGVSGRSLPSGARFEVPFVN